MTQLRDARLEKALAAAADGPARAPDAVRMAVREAAARATASARPSRRSWWRVGMGSADGSRMPWNAALATVLLGVLVTLVWQDREVPGARPEAGRVDAPIPAAPPQPPSEAKEAPAEAAQPASVPAPASQRTAPPPPEPPAPPAPPAPVLQASPRQKDSALASNEAAPAPPPPPPPAAMAREAHSPSPTLRAPAPASMPAAAPQQRGELAERVQSRFAGDPQGLLRFEVAGVKRSFQRQQVPLVAMLVDRTIAAATSRPEGEFALPVDLRVETESGVLELAGEEVRFTPRGEPPRTGRPDPAVLRSLREQLAPVMR